MEIFQAPHRISLDVSPALQGVFLAQFLQLLSKLKKKNNFPKKVTL